MYAKIRANVVLLDALSNGKKRLQKCLLHDLPEYKNYSRGESICCHAGDFYLFLFFWWHCWKTNINIQWEFSLLCVVLGLAWTLKKDEEEEEAANKKKKN